MEDRFIFSGAEMETLRGNTVYKYKLYLNSEPCVDQLDEYMRIYGTQKTEQ